MASGSGFANGKERIVAYFQENHTPKERAEFLKKEYGIGGRVEGQVRDQIIPVLRIS